MVSVSDYISYEKDHTLKTEAYYVTKTSAIHGHLYLHSNYLHFQPEVSDENIMVKICTNLILL
jgi:hypothetical protein